jgi:N-acetylneuraminate synthase/N,N'-diacetyllegionaminate synthase
MYEMFKGLEFSLKDWLRIRDYCQEKKIIFYATVDYIPGVELAEKFGMIAYKIGSWDATNYPLIQRIAQTGKPFQIDLGPVTISEIEKLLTIIYSEGNDQVLLLHCSHAKTDDAINIRSIPYLKKVFDVPVGYSADSRDFVPDLAAVALGANIIEKRLTLNSSYLGHHHIKALEPKELKEYVTMIRHAEALLGAYSVKPSAEDLRQKSLYFVSVVADVDIPAGTTITSEMITCKRPGIGIAPEFLSIIVGRKAQRNIKRNELLSWDSV